MPEIWLNYGSTDVVLDIKAENLEFYLKDMSKNQSLNHQFWQIEK
jgi:hypothetical protein